VIADRVLAGLTPSLRDAPLARGDFPCVGLKYPRWIQNDADSFHHEMHEAHERSTHRKYYTVIGWSR